VPATVSELPGSAVGRLSDFIDRVCLGVLAKLRSKVLDDELRRIQPPLRQGAVEGWTYVQIVVRNRRLVWAGSDADTATTSVASITVDVGQGARELHAEIERRRDRGPEVIGKVVRSRTVLGNAWVIAGTRIPTETLWSFHEAGFDTDATIKQYPHLTPEDVQAAMEHERRLRERGAA